MARLEKILLVASFALLLLPSFATAVSDPPNFSVDADSAEGAPSKEGPGIPEGNAEEEDPTLQNSAELLKYFLDDIDDRKFKARASFVTPPESVSEDVQLGDPIHDMLTSPRTPSSHADTPVALSSTEKGVDAHVLVHSEIEAQTKAFAYRDCASAGVPSEHMKELVHTQWLGWGLLVLVIVQVAVTGYFLAAFYKERRDIYLSSRSPKLILMHVLTGGAMSICMYTLVCVGFEVAHQAGNFAIVVRLCIFVQTFFVPMLAAPIAMRATRLYATAKVNARKVSVSDSMPVSKIRSSSVSSGMKSKATTAMFEANRETVETRYVQLVGWVGLVVMSDATLFFFYSLGKCEVDMVQTYNAIAVSIGGMAVLGYCIYRVRDVPEAFSIVPELYAMGALQILLGCLQLGVFVPYAMPEVVSEYVFAYCFVAWGYLGVFTPLLTAYTELYRPLVLSESVSRYREQINSKNDIAFRVQTLGNPEQREIFFQYLDREFLSQMWLFWKDVETFRDLSSREVGQLNEVARLVYSKYINEGAPLDVELDDDLRIECSWNMQPTHVRADVFDAAQHSVFVKMLCAFPRYLHFKALHPEAFPTTHSLLSASDQDVVDSLNEGGDNGHTELPEHNPELGGIPLE